VAGTRKVGVEEEFLLVDVETAEPTAVSERVLRARDDGSGNGSGEGSDDREAEVEAELFRQQIETSSPPCTDLDELRAGLLAGRRAVAEATAEVGAAPVATGTPVLPPGRQEPTRKPRYQRIFDEYGELARGQLVCAMHVHVEVADDDEGVAVLDGLRPWLPVLLALSANSPYWEGRDTGHASWRHTVWGRWPTARPADPFGSAASYRERTRKLVDWGAAMDDGMLYLGARLSASFPTVEVRVADVCTDVEDAVLVAALTRALVERAVTAPDGGPPPAAWPADLLTAAHWHAARHGLAATLVHPVEQRLAPVREVLGALLTHVRPALDRAGEADEVSASIERLLARGDGASRQRAAYEATGDLAEVLRDLRERTLG
jgi:carboxylate-amine ligase